MDYLSQLAEQYGTDKGPSGHGYTREYERLLWTSRFDVAAVLEIGVLHGASLYMWRDYFPDALVYGADVLTPSGNLSPRIYVLPLNQGNRPELNQLQDLFPDGFDVIVDDGSHDPDHQRLTFEVLFSSVRPSGWYLLEDLSLGTLGAIITAARKQPCRLVVIPSQLTAELCLAIQRV